MKLPRKTPLNLVRNRILIMLNGGGPRTNSELAVLLNNTRGAVSGANSFNISLGYVTYHKEPGASEVTYTITAEGVQHLQTMPSIVTKLVPVPKPTPVKDRILEALKVGLRADNWMSVSNSRNQLYKHITELRHKGYVIEKTKNGVLVTYWLKKAPQK